MTALTDVEVAAGILLIFFVPGFALTKAVFPEWRVRGPDAGLKAVEVATLSFVVSVALAVFVGYLLLLASPGGFQAYWSSPVLEAVLAAVALVGAIVAYARGAFSPVPPPGPSREPDTGEEGAWELMRELDRLTREERRLLHAIRQAPSNAPELAGLTEQLARIRSEEERLRTRREAEYAR
jgi:hypothetical protein